MAKRKVRQQQQVVTPDANVVEQKIGHFVRSSVYRYGSKVLEDRAIPEYRDGLKTAARRILFSMYELGALPDKSFKKSARVTGDCSGRYHPHGSAYSTLVNLAFQRYPLIVPQGSFGNEFDPPAAERYTEVRLAPITDALFSGLPVTQMVPNYSDEFKEPLVFSSRLPLLLLNGSEGVAVGLRNSIPSHNLKEVVDALIYVAKAGDSATLKGVRKHILGPDCIAGGILTSPSTEIDALYQTGRGKLSFQCEYQTEPDDFDPKITIVRITGWPDSWRLAPFVESVIPALTEAKMIRSFDILYNEDVGSVKELRVGVDNKPALDAVLKHLKCSASYSLNVTIRNSVDDIHFKPVGLLELLKMWVTWRQAEESKLLSLRITQLQRSLSVEESRLLAMLNVPVILKVLASTQDPIIQLCSELGCSKDAAKFILDLRIRELRKADVREQQGRISSIKSDIAKAESDQQQLTSVVVRELQALRKYQDDRRTKVTVPTESTVSLVAHGATTAFGVSRDGKVFGDIQPTRTTASNDLFVVGSYSGITLVDGSGLALNVSRSDASGVQGKTYRNIVGVASHDYPYIVAVTADGSVVKVAMSVRGSDFPLSKSPLIRADSVSDSSNLVVWGPRGQVDIIPVSQIPENKRNGRGTKLLKYKPVSACVYHQGTRLVSRGGVKLTKETIRDTEASNILLVGSRNLVAYDSGRRAFLDSSSAIEALAAGGISQIWSLDAPVT